MAGGSRASERCDCCRLCQQGDQGKGRGTNQPAAFESADDSIRGVSIQGFEGNGMEPMLSGCKILCSASRLSSGYEQEMEDGPF